MSKTVYKPQRWLSICVALTLAYAGVGGAILLLDGPGLHGAAIWLVASLSTGVLIYRLARRSDQLVDREQQLHTVIEYATAGILFVGQDGTISVANPAASTIFGRPIAQIVGESFESLLQVAGVDAGSAPSDLLLGSVPTEPRMITTPAGARRWIRVRMGGASDPRVMTVIVTDVTESVEATRKIAEAEHRWNLALEGSGIGVYETDLLAGSCVVSDTWRRLVGFRVGEAIDPEAEWANRIHPDDLARVRQADLDCIEGRAEHVIVEYRFRVVDGSWRWMRSDAKVIERRPDGRAHRLLGTMTDVTDLRQAVDLARTREVELKELIEQSPVAKAVISMDGWFELVNDAFCDFTGYSRTQLESVTLADVPSANDFLRGRRKFKELMEGSISSFSAEKRYVRPDGSERFGLITATRLRAKSGDAPRFVAQIVDVTEARRLSQMRADFVATVSHELRTPLTSINGAIKGILGTMSEQLPEKAVRLLTVASRNGDRLGHLVNDLLDMQKLVSGGADFQFASVEVTELVKQCLVDVSILAEQGGVAMTPLEGSEHLNAEVDANRLKQVMANLLSNAIKFAPRGGTVTTSVRREERALVISVTNPGPGIPRAVGDRVFEPFTQVEDTNTRNHEGSGLGLSIAKSIVERLHGQIGFTSDPGENTTFWVTLPLAKETTRSVA